MNFDKWWNEIGSGITPRNDDMETHAKKVAEAAWKALETELEEETDRYTAEAQQLVNEELLNGKLYDHIAELESLVNAQAFALIEQKAKYEAEMAHERRKCVILDCKLEHHAPFYMTDRLPQYRQFSCWLEWAEEQAKED